MNSVTRLLACASVFCLLSFQRPIASADDGFELKHVPVTQTHSATYLIVNLGKYDVRVIAALVPPGAGKNNRQLAAPERAATGLSLDDYQRLYQARAVASGGYLASFAPPTPLGLLKSNGVLVSRSHQTWLVEGMYCSNAGQALILQWTQDADISNFRDCIQAGPILLHDGKEPNDVPSRQAIGYNKLAMSIQEQTFLCTLTGNRIVLGVTDEVNLPTLVNFLRDKVGCLNAIRFTGAETAGLRVNEQLYGNDRFLFPSALAVIPRK